MSMKVVFGLIIALFVGILVGVYLVARSANPVMLDERGRPVGEASAPAQRP
jgi:F0F1-type ATP synthase assembly protein I